jgi:hypothetical protein
VAHPLSSLILYLLCFLHPVCTQSCYHLQIAPRVALIKSQPLINPFNLSLSSLNLFYVLRFRTRFQRYLGRRVSFSCFTLPDSLSAVPRAAGLVFKFCAPGLVLGGTEGVGSRFHILRFQDSFSAIPRASGSVFMFCAPGLIFCVTEGVGFRFHVLHSRTHFRRFRGCLVSFSCFALPGSFSTVPRATCPVLMFCTPRLVFDGTVGVGSHFHFLLSRTRFRRYRGRRVLF